jgi:transglutaminase-like putative cysteine protease
VLLVVSLGCTLWSAVWEYSVRQYLRGFSDAIIPEAASSYDKAEAILAWMSNGPPRLEVTPMVQISPRDPQDTLNYRQLLEVCGSATNAFLNLSRSAGLPARRLLLLAPNRTTKHVVAEVTVDGRWVVVDATYRAFMKDAHGNLLTRKDLLNPVVFEEAASRLPHYPREYTYERIAHVRLAALPFQGSTLRQLLERLFPGWDEFLDWSLLLERRSFAQLFLSAFALICFMFARVILAWIADRRLHVPRFHLRANLSRATMAFFTTPEIK